MKRFLSAVTALAIVAGFAGCGEESSVENKTTVKTPDGSVTKTSTDKVETTGDAKTNP